MSISMKIYHTNEYVIAKTDVDTAENAPISCRNTGWWVRMAVGFESGPVAFSARTWRLLPAKSGGRAAFHDSFIRSGLCITSSPCSPSRYCLPITVEPIDLKPSTFVATGCQPLCLARLNAGAVRQILNAVRLQMCLPGR